MTAFDIRAALATAKTMGVAMADADMKDDARRAAAIAFLADYDRAAKPQQSAIKAAFNAAYAKRRKMKVPDATDKPALVTFYATLRKAWSRLGALASTGKTNPNRKPRTVGTTKKGGAVPSAVTQANSEIKGEIVQGAVQPSLANKARESATKAMNSALGTLRLAKLPAPMAKQVDVALAAFGLLLNADSMDDAAIETAMNALNVKRSK